MSSGNKAVRQSGWRTVASLAVAALIFSGPPQIHAGGAPDLREVTAALRQQDRAWDDLEIRYEFESDILGEDGNWTSEPTLRLVWKLTQSGWQRVRRERDGDDRKWVEEASFDGEYYMTSDSQGVGSGGIGHQSHPFLYNSYVPRMFGLDVTGLELGQPVSVAEFLDSKDISIESTAEDGILKVRGPDPFAEGMTIELELDANVGYRPRQVLIFDKQGTFSIYTDIKYRECHGARGRFWFPESGLWKGFQPKSREESSHLRYRAQEILVDTHPKKEEFVLTYPSGALMLNTDTGESIYLSKDSTAADVPNFAGKRISLLEHDRGKLATVARQSGRSVLLLINALGIIVILVAILCRPLKNKGTSP